MPKLKKVENLALFFLIGILIIVGTPIGAHVEPIAKPEKVNDYVVDFKPQPKIFRVGENILLGTEIKTENGYPATNLNTYFEIYRADYECCIVPACQECRIDGFCTCRVHYQKGHLDKVCNECQKGIEEGRIVTSGVNPDNLIRKEAEELTPGFYSTNHIFSQKGAYVVFTGIETELGSFENSGILKKVEARRPNQIFLIAILLIFILSLILGGYFRFREKK